MAPFAKVTVRYLSSDTLRVDPRYQRDIKENRIREIINDFDKLVVNDIKVSQRDDGNYYIFDGQHTLAALVRHNKGNPLSVRCKVYRFDGTTDEERFKIEAALFAKQNGVSQSVSAPQKMRANFAAGDPEVLKFYVLTNTSGLSIDFEKKTYAKGGRIVCYSEAWNAWEELGDEAYVDMLMLIKDTWNGQSSSLRSEIIGGMVLFMKKYGARFNRARFIKKLALVSPLEIIREGNVKRESGKYKYMQQIVSRYNAGTRNKI